jgi:hypothetical protein
LPVTTTDIPTELPKIPATNKGSTWRAWLIGAVGIALVIWAVSVSPSFHECIQQRKNTADYSALHERGSIVRATIVRGKLDVVCAEVFVDENDSAISAIAAALIAIFTLALWDATRRLWQSADNQLQAFHFSMQQELNIANRQIAKMGEYVTGANNAAKAMDAVAKAMNATTLATQDAAENAKQSLELANKEFIASHRPRLRVHNVFTEEFGLIATAPGPGLPTTIARPGTPMRGALTATNVGESAATITDNYCMVFVTNEPLPMRPPYHLQMGNEFIADVRLAPDSSKIGDFIDHDGKTASTMSNAQRGTYVMGWIAYRDDNNIPRRMTFCRQWDGPLRRFVSVDNPDYERED